ncbi:hypothetical protein HF1_09500 [Mycoplasma haemofelis str. Langford 1]|uniref:Uncharacterized protein n=1 Tax=Mycoplasma haemofelis (strain Langford 1) TaxID=941640 RepID=E8ZII7_MYCHL|nr:hypothetical protein [Mycoplasma haemofelis]CBY92958.1 hypothetical protein HF1_09500 [Mycoplasma haemofelis str. Langford 1]
MNLASKGACALAGATGLAGGGVLISKNLNPSSDTISKHIKSEYLLTASHNSQWAHRVDLLKKSNDANLKSQLLTATDLQNWCTKSLKEEFKGAQDSHFLNVRLYCGLNIGDKITGNRITTLQKEDAKLKANVDKLAQKQKDELGSELSAIKDKSNATPNWEGNEALKGWCLKTLDLAFEEGSNYENAELYCVTT